MSLASSMIPLAAAGAFDIGGLATNLGTLLGITVESAGWLLGGLFTGVLFTVAIIISSKLESSSPVPMMAFTALGIGLSTLFAWFPIWMAFFVFVLSLASVIGLMANRGGP